MNHDLPMQSWICFPLMGGGRGEKRGVGGFATRGRWSEDLLDSAAAFPTITPREKTRDANALT